MEGRLYQTRDSKGAGVVLQATKTRTATEVFCFGYNALTMLKNELWNAYYPISTLYIVSFGEGQAA